MFELSMFPRKTVRFLKKILGRGGKRVGVLDGG